MRDNFTKYIIGAFLAGAVLVPGTAWAQGSLVGDPTESAEDSLDEAVDEELESGEAAEKPWSVSATLLTRGYQGMFAGLANHDSGLDADGGAPTSHTFDRWLNLYVLSGSYTYEDFSFSAEMLFSHWMTRGGGYTEPYEFRVEDPALSVRWKGYKIDAIDTTVSVRYNATLPVSTVSRTSNLIVGNSLSGTLSRTFFDKLTLSYSLGGSWNAHTTETATYDLDTVQIYRETDPLVRNTGQFPGGRNTQFSLTNALSARVPVWDKLTASVSYSITKGWTYDGPPIDDMSADVEGLQSGRMTRDRTIGSVGLSYPVGDYVSLSGGIRTTQAPKTDDNASFRFPFWNFAGAAANRSAFQLSVTGRY